MPEGMKLLERLIEEGVVDRLQGERAIHHAQRHEQRIEDSLVESGVISEDALLRHLAGKYGTRFVSTSKLAKATIPHSTLELLPLHLAERLGVVPILLDKRTQTLSLVSANLDDFFDIAKQVQVVAGVREVKVFVCRPAAVTAAFDKNYRGLQEAFARLAVVPDPSDDVLAGYGGGGFGLDDTFGHESWHPGAQRPATGEHVRLETLDDDGRIPGGLDLPEPKDDVAGAEVHKAISSPPNFKSTIPDGSAFLPPELKRSPGVILPKAPVEEPSSGISQEDYLESVNVLVALHEKERAGLRGHSSQVARQCRKLCERMGLTDDKIYPVVLAAYLHDLGKESAYHLTALNVAQYEGHKIQARKVYLAPLRLLERVELPKATSATLTHLYERFDGKGFPDRLSGKDIPLGARVLAIVETYADLTGHAKNPYRKKLEPKEAVEVIERYKKQFFDPSLVDMVKMLVLGDDLKAKLLAERHTVLVMDPDPEETAVLEMRLIEQGHEVVIVRGASHAFERIEAGGIDVVITEVDLPVSDGFEFIRELRGGEHQDIPVIFVTRRGDRSSVTRGFELGAADYVVKPAPADVVVAKARLILSRRARARGVSGSLAEMALPDVIQILAHGRKSGRLAIRSRGKKGDVWFKEGQVLDAQFKGVRGAEAFYAMMAVNDGDFQLDPSATTDERVIEEPTETLLLEAMRRMDEGLV